MNNNRRREREKQCTKITAKSAIKFEISSIGAKLISDGNFPYKNLAHSMVERRNLQSNNERGL